MKWWGVFLLVLLLIGAISLISGILTVDANLDLVLINNVTNPMFVLLIFALIIFISVYPLISLFVLITILFRNFVFKSRSQS